MRVRARKDDNHKEIVQTFIDAHISVLDTAALGNGAPDIVIGFRGQSVLIEIKDGSKPPSKRKLTDDEIIFMNGWRGRYVVINSKEEALELIKELAE